ncbi:MAG: DUF2071 domain-containing protein [Burkholderiales bacterium]
MGDRAAPRPRGCPVLHQRWSRLLFLHWRVPPQALRAIVPRALDLDLWEGEAWVGVAVFAVSRMRPSLLPPVPVLSRGYEINVRTYVRRNGDPGLWFFSLDIDNPLAVWGARLAYRLPYFHARMHWRAEDARTTIESERTDARATKARFAAAWETGAPRPSPVPATREHFLLHRFTLFAGDDASLRAQIRHRPWPLRTVEVTRLESTLLAAQGLTPLDEAPLAHAQGQPFDVAIWAPERR